MSSRGEGEHVPVMNRTHTVVQTEYVKECVTVMRKRNNLNALYQREKQIGTQFHI